MRFESGEAIMKEKSTKKAKLMEEAVQLHMRTDIYLKALSKQISLKAYAHSLRMMDL